MYSLINFNELKSGIYRGNMFSKFIVLFLTVSNSLPANALSDTFISKSFTCRVSKVP